MCAEPVRALGSARQPRAEFYCYDVSQMGAPTLIECCHHARDAAASPSSHGILLVVSSERHARSPFPDERRQVLNFLSRRTVIVGYVSRTPHALGDDGASCEPN